MRDLVSPEELTGPLNPEWVEWLMGWPLGWTDLKPLAMDKFREWQQQHSGRC
jgi:DNA (cytosine-5)-methyltransferase 1